jgi:hypothetical protein
MREDGENPDLVEKVLRQGMPLGPLGDSVSMESVAILATLRKYPAATATALNDWEWAKDFNELKKTMEQSLLAKRTAARIRFIALDTKADHLAFLEGIEWWNLISLSPNGAQTWHKIIPVLQLLQQLMVGARDIRNVNEYYAFFLDSVCAREYSYMRGVFEMGGSKSRFGYLDEIAFFVFAFGPHLPDVVVGSLFGLKYAMLRIAELRFHHEAKIAEVTLQQSGSLYTMAVPRYSPEEEILNAGLSYYPYYPGLTTKLAMLCAYAVDQEHKSLMHLLYRSVAQGRKRLVADHIYPAGTVCADMNNWVHNARDFWALLMNQDDQTIRDMLKAEDSLVLYSPSFTTRTVALGSNGRIIMIPYQIYEIEWPGGGDESTDQTNVVRKCGVRFDFKGGLPSMDLSGVEPPQPPTFIGLLEAVANALPDGTIMRLVFYSSSLKERKNAHALLNWLKKELLGRGNNLPVTFLTKDSKLYKDSVSSFPDGQDQLIKRKFKKSGLYIEKELYHLGNREPESESSPQEKLNLESMFTITCNPNSAVETHSASRNNPVRNHKPAAAMPAPARKPNPAVGSNPESGSKSAGEPNFVSTSSLAEDLSIVQKPSTVSTSSLAKGLSVVQKPGTVSTSSLADKPSSREGIAEKEVIIIVNKKGSGKQSVAQSFVDSAANSGWINLD